MRFVLQALQEFWIRTDYFTDIAFPSHLLGAVISSTTALKAALVLSGSKAEGSFRMRRYSWRRVSPNLKPGPALTIDRISLTFSDIS